MVEESNGTRIADPGHTESNWFVKQRRAPVRSVKYGLGVLGVALGYRMQKWGLARLGMYRTLFPSR